MGVKHYLLLKVNLISVTYSGYVPEGNRVADFIGM